MFYSAAKIRLFTFRTPGTRMFHLSFSDFGSHITACPQTLDVDVKPGDTWLPSVHVDKRTIQGVELSPDALSALDEGLQMLRADCVAVIEEIDKRFV